MNRMTLGMLWLLASLVQPAEATSNVVARVFGKDITAEEIGLTYDADRRPVLPKAADSSPNGNPVEKLSAAIVQAAVREYVSLHQLKATDAEVREMQAWQEAFAARERARRKADLENVELRLADQALAPKEREQLEKRRSTLLRLAAHERRQEASPQPTTDELREVYGPWIEGWKFNQSVYDRFAGVVADTKFGPAPIGATARLLRSYERRGQWRIHDAALRRAFWKVQDAPPPLRIEAKKVDFTPFWKKPLQQEGDR